VPPTSYAPTHRRATATPSSSNLRLPDLRRRGVVGLVGAGLCAAAAAGALAAPQAVAGAADAAPSSPPRTGDPRVDLEAERAAALGGTSRSIGRSTRGSAVEALQEVAQRVAAEQAAAEAARVAAERAAAEATRVAAEQAAAEAARVAAEQASDQAAQAAAEARRLADAWVLPTSDYRITARFGTSGSRWSSGHTGLDFAAPLGTPVVAVHAGIVHSVGWAGPYGRRIVVQHSDGTETWYCHPSATSAAPGEAVGTGETIGLVGSTGNSTGPHLHLEVRPSGSPVDPRSFLATRGATP
jgi:murein DD-endopeptidase MepM/ murein hydrolase activator NlpD